MSARTDTVTDVRPGDYVMHVGKRTRVVEVNEAQRSVTLDHPVSNPAVEREFALPHVSGTTREYEMRQGPSGWVWPNQWPISTLHSLDCQCFAVHS